MFTIVIPLYNKELSIRNTIESVLNQTYQNFEIVIVNDGSTDNSIETIDAITISDDRIKVVHQKNQGVSVARNCGIKEANYEWVAFLDGDDLWEIDHLEEITKMMDMFPKEKVYVTSFEYSDKRPMFKYPRKNTISKIDNYFKEAIREKLMWTSIVVANKECFDKVGFFNPNLNRGEDLDLWARLAREYRIIKSTKITALYINEDLSSLTSSKSNYNESILSIIELKGKKKYERAYFKEILFNRIKLDIKTLAINDLVKILIKHNIELIK